MFPLALPELLGHWNAYVVYLIIGFAFGYVLEISGFADSRKLAAQFYFKELTVLKVMFGAIVTAMVLVFLTTGLGWLDFNLVWVNPTYLWPGILGGLVMGVGFIVGGFCPGTSLVSAAVLKLDGLFFVFGVFIGIFLFGETVGLYEEFWHSSYFGRFTLMDWLNLPAGVVVLLLILMALFMFWGSEQLEKWVGKRDLAQEPKWRYGAAATLVAGALAVMVIGQPTTADRWAKIEGVEGVRLAAGEVQIHPGELLTILDNPALKVIMLDVRQESDYNLFHIRDARHVPLDQILSLVPALHDEGPNVVTVLMSNDEDQATAAWKLLRAESVPSVYILEGGINQWIATFAEESFWTEHFVVTAGRDTLHYTFPAALGANYPFAHPLLENYELSYTPKVKLEIKRGPAGGGCG